MLAIQSASWVLVHPEEGATRWSEEGLPSLEGQACLQEKGTEVPADRSQAKDIRKPRRLCYAGWASGLAITVASAVLVCACAGAGAAPVTGLAAESAASATDAFRGVGVPAHTPSSAGWTAIRPASRGRDVVQVGLMGYDAPLPLAAPEPVAPPDALEPAFRERMASESLDRLGPGLRVRREKRGAVITLASDELGEPGQWGLSSHARWTLDMLGPALRAQYGHAIVIQAYTDSLGTTKSNDALSLRRAEAVRDYLVAGGLPPDQIVAIGLGARKPAAENSTSEGRAQNRRIEIVIAP